jgi:RNA polymerase sigma-70 factor (ECF subfamily)
MSESDVNQLPDSELIARAKRGETEAFGQLYERYVDQIFRYVRTRVADDQDAEDLTENIFVRSFESLATYEERGWVYSAFLYQVARNLLVDHYRQDGNQQPLDMSEPIEAAGPSLEQRLTDKEEVARIKEAMTRLPDDYQEIIRLRLLLDLPTSTAAEWMDRSEGAARVLLHRALKALREGIES